MNYGINTVLWIWPFTHKNLDLFKKIKEMGYDTVEIAVEDMSENNLKIIKTGLKEYNLNCVICGVYGPDRNIMSINEDVQKKGVEYIKKVIDIAGILSAKMIVGPTYSIGIYPEFLNPDNKKRAWDNCVKNLKEAGKYASIHGKYIAVEPLNRYESNFLNTAKDTLALIKNINSPNIGVQLDVYHMNIEEKDLEKAIISTGKNLFHLHVSEHDRGTPGTGHTDWTGVAHALHKISFNGCVVIESCDPKVEVIAEAGAIWRTYDYGQDELAQKGLEFIRRVL
ncbi:MAG: sugar phosphate isomerase/epimerase [Bacteroidetes bacterium]|nr:sugar phosphate isomerase/epimerase [Bacteroidota bacterium]